MVRAQITRSARWRRKRRPGFAGLAKSTDRRVKKRATPLVDKLSEIRSAIGVSIFGKAEKADGDVAALTRKQYDDLKKKIDAIEDAAYADALYDVATELVDFCYQEVRELLELDTGFDVVPTWAIDEMRSHADEIAGLVAERDRKTLSLELERALTDGLSAKDTAAALRSAFVAGVTAYDEDGKAVRTTPASSWFDMVARTELQRASNLGQMALYRKAQIETVRWQAAEPCDECADFDDETYALDDVPQGGPPIHPNCRCVLVPVDDDLGDFGGTDDDRAAARRGNSPASDEE